MNVLVYGNIDWGIQKGKLKNALNEKWKKLHGFSISINIANFEVFVRTKKVDLKPLFLEESDFEYPPHDYSDFLSSSIFFLDIFSVDTSVAREMSCRILDHIFGSLVCRLGLNQSSRVSVFKEFERFEITVFV